jgi:hypothetical protein
MGIYLEEEMVFCLQYFLKLGVDERNEKMNLFEVKPTF